MSMAYTKLPNTYSVEYISQVKAWRAEFVSPTGVEFEAFLPTENAAKRWIQDRKKEWRVRDTRQ